MSIDRATCYTVTCDSCRTVFDESTDYIVHFTTPDDAIRYVVEHGWTLTDNGDVICHRCTAGIRCTREGHDYSPWHPCHCKGRIPEHALFGCGLFRFCHDCDHHENATLATLPTIEEPHTFGC